MKKVVVGHPPATAKLPAPSLLTSAMVWGFLGCAGLAYLGHVVAPNLVSTPRFLAISSAILILMAGSGILSQLAPSGQGQLFTAKTLFLLGSIVFLGGGEISSTLLSNQYSNYPEKYVLLTSCYMLAGTACFLAGYGMGGPVHSKRSAGRTLAPLPAARLWFGSAIFLAIWAAGSIEAHTYHGAAGTQNPWEHLVEFGIPAGLMLTALMARKTSSPLERFIAGVLLCPLLFEYATSWSRRPLQTILVAGLAYYVATKRLGSRRQLGLLISVAAVFLALSVSQAWYRQVVYVRHQSIESATTDSAIEQMKKMAEGGGMIDTFDAAAATTTIYSTGKSYLYGESIVALLVNPVPRRFWPEKPVGFGLTLSKEVFHTNHPWTNLGPSIEAEIFANGGLWAVLPGMFLIGLACCWYDSLLQGRKRTEAAVLIHSLGVYQFFFWVRGDFLDVGYSFLITVVPALILLHLPEPALRTDLSPVKKIGVRRLEPGS